MSPIAAPIVPATLEEVLTPEWLTGALSQRFPGIEVTRVTPGPVIARVSTNARFTIECAGGVPEGLAPTLCVKGYFTDDTRQFAFVGEPEAYFYRDLADATGIRTFRCVHAGIDPETHHGVIITEDVVAAGGEFLDALSPYTVDQTAASLEQFARLHASTWKDPRWAEAAWLGSRLSSFIAHRGIKEITGNFDGPLGLGVPVEVRDPARLFDAFGMLVTRSGDEDQQTVIHGDGHIGNVFLDAQGRPGLADWQCVHHGYWGLDVGYHIASALDPSDRERGERDLLAHYLDELRANGVEPPSWDDAWDEYRKGIVYGFFMWAITLRVHPDIIERLLQRLGTATAAHDCYAALGV